MYKYNYFLKTSNPRPNWRLVFSFLWGDDQNVDTEGDADILGSTGWTELYLCNRENEKEIVCVSPVKKLDEYLLLEIDSDLEYLVARTVFFLSTTTKGEVALSQGGPFTSPSILLNKIGKDFDLEKAWERVKNSRLSKLDP